MSTLTLFDVLKESEDYKFRDDVVGLAQDLMKINDAYALATAAAVSKIRKIAYDIDLDASVLKQAWGPVADACDQLEAAMDQIIDVVANRPEAYTKPPAGIAEVVVLTPGSPTEQS